MAVYVRPPHAALQRRSSPKRFRALRQDSHEGPIADAGCFTWVGGPGPEYFDGLALVEEQCCFGEAVPRFLMLPCAQACLFFNLDHRQSLLLALSKPAIHPQLMELMLHGQAFEGSGRHRFRRRPLLAANDPVDRLRGQRCCPIPATGDLSGHTHCEHISEHLARVKRLCEILLGTPKGCP